MLENLPPIISYIKSIVSTASILVAAYLAYYFGMKSYFKQQQASRVQKLYYEDTLLAILKHADEVINDFANGYTRFVAALTRLKEVRRSNAPITQTEINEFDHFISDIKRTNFYMSSSRELLIDVFGKPGYILYKWLFKCDQDCGMFCSAISEALMQVKSKLNQQVEITDKFLTQVLQHYNQYHKLILRHSLLPVFLHKLFLRIGEMTFKSRKALLSELQNDSDVKNILSKAEEAFKILFGWYELPDDKFLSYLIDENGNRYIFDRNGHDTVKTTLEQPPESISVKIVKNEQNLITTKIVDKGKLYTEVQLGMANCATFNERPEFLPTIDAL